MRGEFVDVGGARLYYYAAGTRGAGEPILLIHGFPTSSHLWSDVVPLLPAGHRVVVVDLLGYGRSDRPGAPSDGRGDGRAGAPIAGRGGADGIGRGVGITAHADRLVALLDLLRIEKAAVVGHDMGGGIAQAMALRAPARISSLCLIDAAAFDASPSVSVRLGRAVWPMTRLVPASLLLSVVRTHLARGYTDPERGIHSVDQYLRPFTHAQGRDAFMAHVRALVPRATGTIAQYSPGVTRPTAIIWGADDPFLPVRIGRRLHETIPGSTLDVLPDARHFLPEESPEKVAGIIARLLARSAP
jgi:pimeloyl-ACP methyl ester carboxylesterase